MFGKENRILKTCFSSEILTWKVWVKIDMHVINIQVFCRSFWIYIVGRDTQIWNIDYSGCEHIYTN